MSFVSSYCQLFMSIERASVNALALYECPSPAGAELPVRKNTPTTAIRTIKAIIIISFIKIKFQLIFKIEINYFLKFPIKNMF